MPPTAPGWTKGPWEVDHMSDTTVVETSIREKYAMHPSRYAVAWTNAEVFGEEQAACDARLIASAPALYAIVEKVAGESCRRGKRAECASRSSKGELCVTCEARAALSLASGRTP